MKTFSTAMWVGLGGFLGTNARFFLGRWAALRFGVAFPYGTFIINISGSFLLGLAATLINMRLIPFGEQFRLTLAVGFIGAYTTFSTYEYESHTLMENGNWTLAALNLIGSLVAGLIALRLGVWMARRWA